MRGSTENEVGESHRSQTLACVENEDREAIWFADHTQNIGRTDVATAVLSHIHPGQSAGEITGRD